MPNIYEVQIKDPIVVAKFTHLFQTKTPTRYIISEACLDLLKEAEIRPKIIKTIDISRIEQHIIYPYRNFLYSTPDQGAIDEISAKIVASERDGKLPYAIFFGRNPELAPGAFILDRVGRQRNYQWKIVDAIEKQKSLAETFPKLLRLMEDEDTKVVLSFGAGGLRFFAHPSVMKFINAIRAKSYIDEVWGCSGGAFSAYAYAMGATPEDIEQKGYDIYHGRCDLRFALSRFEITRMRLLDRILPLSPNLIKEYALIHLMMRNALSQLVTSKELEIPFYCTAYNIQKEHNDILSPLKLPKIYKDFIIHAKAIDSIVASSTIPVIYVPKMIRSGFHKEYYIDGAIAEDVPLLPVYRKWTIDRANQVEKRKRLLILAINTFPRVANRHWLRYGFFKKMPFMKLLRYTLRIFDLFMNIRFDEKFETISQDPKVKVLRINLPLNTPAFLDCKAIPTIIYNAQTNLIKKLLEVEGSL